MRYVSQECNGLLEKMHQFQGYGGPLSFRQLVTRLYVCFGNIYGPCFIFVEVRLVFHVFAVFERCPYQPVPVAILSQICA